MPEPTILLIEDEPSLSDVILLNLRMQQYQVDHVADGLEALERIHDSYYDLVIIDIMLPNVDGFTICEQLRQQNKDTRILIMSAKDSSLDKIKGLKLGADDYLAKPFELEELILRVQALLRREIQATSFDSFSFGKNKIDFKNQVANNGFQTIQLTKKEADLLRLLLEKQGEVISRDFILKHVWGYDVLPNTRTIDNFILAFRKYFEKDPKNPKYFHSVWGVGYRFTP